MSAVSLAFVPVPVSALALMPYRELALVPALALVPYRELALAPVLVLVPEPVPQPAQVPRSLRTPLNLAAVRLSCVYAEALAV